MHDEDEIFSMVTSKEDSQLIVNGKIHDYVIENATTSNSYQKDDKDGKEEDNLLSAVFFHNSVLQQEDFLSPYIPVTSNLDEKDDNNEGDHANAFSNQPFYHEHESNLGIKGNDEKLDLSTILSHASKVET